MSKQENGVGSGKMPGYGWVAKRRARLWVFLLLFAPVANAQNPEANKVVPAASRGPETAAASGAVAERESRSRDYLVGEGDILQINVWKEPEISQRLVVRPDGKISVPLVREVKVSGLTPVQIEALLVAKLKAFLADPRVTVTVAEIHSKMVYITGGVVKPGAYPLEKPMSVAQLIATAGGLSQFAKGKRVVIMRNEDGRQERIMFNYHDYVRGRSRSQDPELQAGDSVVVQ